VHGGGAGPRSGNPDTVIAYNSSGNPTARSGNALTFDAYNQLTAYGSVMSAGYTGDGLRAWKNSSAGTPYFLYDGAQPVVEFNFGGAITAVNTFGPNGLLSRHSGSASTFYQFDPQGSVAQRLNSAGAVLSSDMYDAYGFGQSTGSNSDPWGYGAQWGYFTDRETGLLLLTHRYYDPSAGRFLNRDPIGVAGGLNLYGYTGGNPVAGADPLGLSSILALPVNVAAALQAGDIEYAAFLLGEAGFSRAALLQATRLFIQNPTVQRLLQPAFQGMWRLGSANLPPCDVVGNRVLYALNNAGVEGVKLYLLENPAGLQLSRPAATFGYHYFVEVGDTVIDSITGPAGQSFNNWVQRFGPATQQLLRSGRFQDVTQKVVDWQIKGLPGFSSH
jgi:RHS repeat-associated protein